MISKRNLVLVLSAGIALTVSGIAIGVWRDKVQAAETEKAWEKLTALVPAVALNSTNAGVIVKSDWLICIRNIDHEVGQLTLKDGSVWQFAFASHHALERPESRVVFKSGSNVIRAQGYGFCCEVEFGELNQPENSMDVLDVLKVEFGFSTKVIGPGLN